MGFKGGQEGSKEATIPVTLADLRNCSCIVHARLGKRPVYICTDDVCPVIRVVASFIAIVKQVPELVQEPVT